MKKQTPPRKETLAKELRNEYGRWQYLYENGGSDPFWPDGTNLNLVRNHIIYYRRMCEEQLKPDEYPEEYYYDLPVRVPVNFIVNAEKNREQAKAKLEKMEKSADYRWLKGRKEKDAVNLMKIIGHYSSCIINNSDGVQIRSFLKKDIEEDIRSLRKKLDTPKAEKIIPQGQISLFDLFEM